MATAALPSIPRNRTAALSNQGGFFMPVRTYAERAFFTPRKHNNGEQSHAGRAPENV